MYIDKPVGHLLANLDVTNGANTDRVVQPLADPCVHLSCVAVIVMIVMLLMFAKMEHCCGNRLDNS